MPPNATGAATRWHGYSARDGFGMTLTKYQINAASPMTGNSHLAQRHWRFTPTTRPVFPQTSNKPFIIGMSCLLFKYFASQLRASPAAPNLS
jgi:hypothetical protein